MASRRSIVRPGVSVPTLSAEGGARVGAGVAAAALTALFAAADPVYGPDYGPTDFSLPGAFATTNYYPVPTAGTVRYVAPNVPKGSANNGTSFSQPWNLYDALSGGRAANDTTLILSGGVYRVAHYTATELYVTKRLTLQPYLDQQVWLKGSIVIESAAFTQSGAVWYTPWIHNFTNILNAGTNTHYYIDEAVNPIADDGGMVFDRKGQPLRQVPTLAEVGPGRFCVDTAAQRLYVGDNPADICPVESTACKNGLMAYSAAKAVTLRGLGVTHFAGRGIFFGSLTGRVENCVAVWNGNAGLSMSSATGSVVRGCTFACNGQNGATGGGLDALFEGNLCAYNNVEKFKIDFGAAGHKTTSFACSNMVFRGNVFERNYAMGLWLDCSVYNALICDNVMRFNRYYGIHVEISHGNSVAFNTLYGNGHSDIFVLNAPHNRVYNNTLSHVLDTGLRVHDQTRRNLPGETSFSDDPAAAAAGNMFDTYTNHFANNLLSRVSPSGYPLFRAHDTAWPGQASFGAADAMVTLSKNNLYNRPDAAAALISARADLTVTTTNYTDLALFRQHYPGFENGSVSYEGTDPFFRDAAVRDYRPRANSPAIGAATPLPADLAARCGRPANIGYAGALAPWDEGWWRFDEASGPALDSAASNHGTLSGPVRVPGKGYGALSFDGVTDRVDFTTNLAHLSGALTVSAWVKPDRLPNGAGRVIANTFNWTGTAETSRGWQLGNHNGSNDVIFFHVFSPAGGVATAVCNNFFSTWSNRWVHVAGVFKPATSGNNGYVALYTNGVPAGTQGATAFTAIGYTNATNLRIGMRADNPIHGPWSGLIDEVRVFGAALNASEISAIMPVAEGRWRFDETDGLNKAYDSVNANTGSVINATYTDAGKGGSALMFNGSNSRVDFTTNLAHLSNAISVSAWVKPDRPPSAAEYRGRVIANTFLYGAGGNASRRGWLLGCQFGSSDIMQFHVSSPTGGLVSATCTGFFKTWSNRWVHVAGVFRPGESVALYTNGVLAAQKATVFTAIGVTNRNLRIGTRAEDTNQGMWSGLIDEVQVYDGALSPAALAEECAAAPNCPPEVAVTAPASGASFGLGETVLLEAEASDPDGDGRIARVEFYADGVLLGVTTHWPYRLLWTSHGAGKHLVTAKAYDARDGATVSPAVAVTLRSLMEDFAGGRWRFDVPPDSGNTAQDSVADNDGILGGGNPSYVPSRVPGKFGGALSFDGVNDRVDFGTNLAHLSGALTVAAWVKPDRLPNGAGRVIANTFNWAGTAETSRGWQLGNHNGSNDVIFFHVFSPAGGVATAVCNNFFSTWSNRWVHVAGVFKPATSGNNGYVALYTNGVPAGTQGATAFTAIGYTNATNLRIGMRADNPIHGPWSGLIDEVRVFGAALPQNELDALCSSPAGEWPFEEAPTCWTASNRLENAHHGTLSSLAMRVSGGHAGKALSFDGVSNRVDFSTNLAHLAGALTVAAWVKPDRPPNGAGRVIANTFNWAGTAETSRGWQLGNHSGSNDVIFFHVFSPAGGVATAVCNKFFSTWSNRWVHVAAVFKPGESLAIYTNGMSAGPPTPTTFTAIGYTNVNLRIGMRADNPIYGPWSGLIDEVRIYDGALPLFAIQALANGDPMGLTGILSVPPQPNRATVLMVR